MFSFTTLPTSWYAFSCGGQMLMFYSLPHLGPHSRLETPPPLPQPATFTTSIQSISRAFLVLFLFDTPILYRFHHAPFCNNYPNNSITTSYTLMILSFRREAFARYTRSMGGLFKEPVLEKTNSYRERRKKNFIISIGRTL